MNVLKHKSGESGEMKKISDGYNLLFNFFYQNYLNTNAREFANIYVPSLLDNYKVSNDLLYSLIVTTSIDELIKSKYMNNIKIIPNDTGLKQLAGHFLKKKILVVVVNMAMSHLNTQYSEIAKVYAKQSKAYVNFVNMMTNMYEKQPYKLNILMEKDFNNNQAIEKFLSSCECCLK